MIEIPKTLTDNEIAYLMWFESSVKYKDPLADIDVRRKEKSLSITITPSNPDFRQSLIQNNLDFHRNLGLKIVYSKSLGISKKIQFLLDIGGS